MTRLGAIVAVLAACVGCGPDRSPVNHFVEASGSFHGIHRVIMVGLRPDRGGSAIAGHTTEALFTAIQARKLFHLDVVDAADPACRDLPLDKREAFTMAELKKMREELRSDAVLFGAVTNFQTHPRMRMGLYLRLLDLAAGTLVWGIDHTWDSTDKATEKRMKDFFDSQMREGYTPADWRLARMSPRTFQKFVAYEIAETLPSR